MFLLAILIPACASSSPIFHMIYSAYKLNQQGDNIQPWRTLLSILNQSIVPCPVLTIASWPPYRFLRRNVKYNFMLIWYPCVSELSSELYVISFADINIFLFCFLIAFILHVPHFHTCPLTIYPWKKLEVSVGSFCLASMGAFFSDTRARARKECG